MSDDVARELLLRIAQAAWWSLLPERMREAIDPTEARRALIRDRLAVLLTEELEIEEL